MSVLVIPKLNVRSLGSLLDQQFEPLGSLLSPWLTKRHLSFMYAESGTGKSFLAQSIGLAVATGGSLFTWNAPEPSRVLFVDGEMRMEDLQERSELLMPGIGGNVEAARENFRFIAQQDQSADFQFPDLASLEGQDVLMQEVNRFRPDLVIFDNFSTLCEVDDENAASSFNPVLKFLRTLKLTGVSVILVHHSRKDGNSYRGSSKMEAIFDTIIQMRLPGGVASRGGARFELRWHKIRALRDDRTANFEGYLVDGRWHSEPLKAEEIQRLVQLVMKCEYGSQKALAHELAVTQGQISKLKAKAIAQGLITRKEWDACLDAAQDEAQYDPYGLTSLVENDDEEADF